MAADDDAIDDEAEDITDEATDDDDATGALVGGTAVAGIGVGMGAGVGVGDAHATAAIANTTSMAIMKNFRAFISFFSFEFFCRARFCFALLVFFFFDDKSIFG
jgi:hypothetical protein